MSHYAIIQTVAWCQTNGTWSPEAVRIQFTNTHILRKAPNISDKHLHKVAWSVCMIYLSNNFYPCLGEWTIISSHVIY